MSRGPRSAKSGFTHRSKTASLNHLVGAGKQRRWNFEAKRPRGRKVDHEFELARLDNWQIGRLGALQDSDSIGADLAERFDEARPVSHQAACFRIFTCIIDGGNCVTCRQGSELEP